MKRAVILIALIALVLAANCQKKDQTFDVTVRFNQGIQFGDGTIMNTAATGAGVVTWEAITGKPTLFPPSAHSHDLLYKPLSWMPTWANVINKPVFSAVATSGSFNDLADVPEFIQIEEALPLLPGIELGKLTQAQIDALTPKEGTILINKTDTTMQVYLGGQWQTFILGGKK